MTTSTPTNTSKSKPWLWIVAAFIGMLGVFLTGFVFVARHWIDGLIGGSDKLTLLQSFTISSSDVLLACVTVAVAALLLSLVSSLLATRRFLDV